MNQSDIENTKKYFDISSLHRALLLFEKYAVNYIVNVKAICIFKYLCVYADQ